MAANTEWPYCETRVSESAPWGIHDITQNSEAQPPASTELGSLLKPGDDPDTFYVLDKVLHKVLYCSASK